MCEHSVTLCQENTCIEYFNRKAGKYNMFNEASVFLKICFYFSKTFEI